MEMMIMAAIGIVSFMYWRAYNNVSYKLTRDHDYWTQNQHLLSEEDRKMQNAVKNAIRNGRFDKQKICHIHKTGYLSLIILLPNETNLSCTLHMKGDVFRFHYDSGSGYYELLEKDFQLDALAHLIENEINDYFNQKKLRSKEALLASIQ